MQTSSFTLLDKDKSNSPNLKAFIVVGIFLIIILILALFNFYICYTPAAKQTKQTVSKPLQTLIHQPNIIKPTYTNPQINENIPDSKFYLLTPFKEIKVIKTNRFVSLKPRKLEFN